MRGLGRTRVLETAREAHGRGFWGESWHRLKRHRLATAGLVIFILFFWVALVGRILTTGSEPVLDPSQIRLPEKLRPPLAVPRSEVLSPQEEPALGIYLLGTDELGRDVFARMMQGAWVSLTVGFVAVGIAVVIGVILGGVAGYYGRLQIRFGHLLAAGGWVVGGTALIMGRPAWAAGLLVFGALWSALAAVGGGAGRRERGAIGWCFFSIFSIDTLIMRFVDIMLCFPSFFLILTVVALLPPSIYNIMAVIGLTSWMGATRFVRAEFLALREQDFVAAAQALGIPDRRIIFRHLLPNAMAPVLVSATIGIATAILTEAGLSFLGFGVPPPLATWGNILSDGKRFLFDAPWLTVIPGVAILIVVLAFNLFGEGLREVLNPRLRE
jgi:peptide/nickel transport system permease protein